MQTDNEPMSDGLPESVLTLLDGDTEETELTDDQLHALSKTILDARTLNKNHRQQSGIEDIWLKAEEAYIGMDDGNRAEFRGRRFHVPTTMEGSVRTNDVTAAKDLRSTLYVRQTARYVDVGAAKVQEILIPPDEKSYTYEPTPVPDLIDQSESEKQHILPDGTPAERDATPDEMQSMPMQAPPPQDPTQPQTVPPPPGVPLTEGDLAAEALEVAKKKAKKAEKRVDDWKVEANYAAHMRRVLFDAARIGTGVLKGPFPCLRKSMAITQMADPETGQMKTTLAYEEKLAPDWAAVSAWDIFPSSSCGEKIGNSEWFFHRDYLSRKQVEDLGELPGYINKHIAQVLKEGPNKILSDQTDNPTRLEPQTDTRYEAWYGYGRLTRDEWDTIQRAGDYAGDEKPQELKEGQKSVYAIVTLLNDCIVYASVNPLHSGTIPFYTLSWQDRPGSWAGVGIAEQIEVPQRMLVSSVRALLDNAGVSAGAQIVIDRDTIEPFDVGDYTIRRNKLWHKKPECDDVSKAFAIFQIPNITAQMLEIINLSNKIAEDSCNIPLISQGQSGDTTPDTYGATQLQNNNANQLLRSIASRVSDSMIEPENRATYEYLLLDPSVPEDEKGDFHINARGAEALAERAIQDQASLEIFKLIVETGDLTGLDPKRAAIQVLKARRLDPENWKFSKEELDAKSKQPPPKAPQVQVAEIKAQVDQLKVQKDTDRDTAAFQAQSERTQIERETRMQELVIERELALLKYANDQKISLMEVKAQLETNAQKLAVQKELSVLSAEVGLRKHGTPEAASPPTEPAGTAEPGKSFEQ